MKKLVGIILVVIFLLLTPNQTEAVCRSCQESTFSSLRNSLSSTSPGSFNVEENLNSLANSSSSFSANLEQLRVKLRKRMVARQEEIKEAKTTLRERFSQAKITRIKNFFKQMVRKYLAAIDRLEKLISRITSRLDKIEAANSEIDIASIREEIQIAQDKLSQARQALADAQKGLEIILNSEKPKEDFADVANLLRQVKLTLIEVHRQLVHLIGDIRGLRVGDNLLPTLSVTQPSESSQEGI